MRNKTISKRILIETWRGMQDRCYNNTTAAYGDYGGRGITVCDRWLHPILGFIHFASDMGIRPDGHSLDRIDNDKGYSPDNCKWSTRVEQQRNRRTNKMITFDGRTMCQSAWGELLGIPYRVIAQRLHLGWTIEKTLTTPARPRKPNRQKPA